MAELLPQRPRNGNGNGNGKIPVPTASFTASRTSGTAPLAVIFDASDSEPGRGRITSYSWRFGDNQTGNGRVVTHTYSIAGTYTVELTVTQTAGQTDATTETITVTDAPPIAQFSFSPVTGKIPPPLDVTFDARASKDPDGTVISYVWDFGDGNTGAGSILDHLYALPGTYTAQLTVKDNAGLTSTISGTVTAVPRNPPVARFTPKQVSGIAPFEVTFDASGSSADGTITLYAWDFGDRSPTGKGGILTHTYSDPGTYTVQLTVTEDGGLTGFDAGTIIVQAPQKPIAKFTFQQSTIPGSLDVTFDASGSNDPDGRTITNYTWDFGDQQTGTGGIQTHTYSKEGQYIVSLTVTDSAGLTGSTTQNVTVKSIQPPKAQFSIAAAPLVDPLAIECDASDPSGTITGYTWDFGDQSPQTHGKTTTHKYANGGTYTVTLTVVDNNGLTGQASQIIIVPLLTAAKT